MVLLPGHAVSVIALLLLVFGLPFVFGTSRRRSAIAPQTVRESGLSGVAGVWQGSSGRRATSRRRARPGKFDSRRGLARSARLRARIRSAPRSAGMAAGAR